MSSSSETDTSSSYSSDDEVPASHTMLDGPTMSNETKLDFDDVENFVSFMQQEELDILDNIPLKKRGFIVPSSARELINNSILERIQSVIQENQAFGYIKSPLLTFMNDDLAAPRNVLCDVFIFMCDGPVIVLTFVKENHDHTIRYNSTLARCLTVAVRRQTGSDFYPVNGVVDKAVWESQDSFSNVISQLEEKAAKVALPLSMNLGRESLRVVLKIFGQFLRNVRLSHQQSALFKMFVETTAYKETRKKVLEAQERFFILTGGPGEGKTAIGKRLCYDYQQKGFNTTFYNRQQDVNWEFPKGKQHLLVVCDNVEHYIDLDWIKNKTNISGLVLILIMQNYDLRFSHGSNQIDFPIVDITAIQRQAANRKEQSFQILQVLLTDTDDDTLQGIMDTLPACVGIPKMVKQYHQDGTSDDPLKYFAYPIKYFISDMEKISETSNMEAFLYLLLCGGHVHKYNNYEQKLALKVVQSQFPHVWEEYVLKRLNYFIGSYLVEVDNTVSFSHQIIYDACLCVLDAKFPGLLWGHCKVLFDDEGNKWNNLPVLTILVTKYSNDIFLKQLVEDTKAGQFKHTLSHGTLKRDVNIASFFRDIGNSFKDIAHAVDDSENFLYWVVHSLNDHLCKEVLMKEDITQEDINGILRYLTVPERTKYFLFLRKHLRALHRQDITYSAEAKDENGQTLLMLALERNIDDVLDKVIDDSRDLQMRNVDNNTAFHMACLNGNVNAVKCLLSKVPVFKDMKGQKLRTPVMMSAQAGYGKLFTYLADEEKCQLKGTDENGDSLLHLACIGGNLEIVEKLFSSKEFDLKQRGQYGRSLLMTAAFWSRRDVFTWLLEHHCHISAQDFDISDYLPLGHVEQFQTLQMFLQARSYGFSESLLKRKSLTKKLWRHIEDKLSNMKLTDEHGTSLLHQAAKSGHVKLAALLLSEGRVDINIRDGNSCTPVMFAAATGKTDIFDFFTERNCDLSLIDNSSNRILHFVCQGGNSAILRKVIDRRYTELNSKNDLGRTPIALAVENGDEDMVSKLTELGCDLSVVDSDGNTLLHVVCKRGSITLMNHLLSWKEMHANLNAVNNHKQTPIMIATKNYHTDMACQLISYGVNITVKDYEGNDILFVAAMTGNTRLVQWIVNGKIPFSFTRDKDGKTAPMVAAQHCQWGVFRILSEKKFSLDGRDEADNTVLHTACLSGSVEIVRQILSSATIDLSVKNAMGKGPVMIAAENGHKDVFDLLVLNGATLTEIDKDKHTVLHGACRGGNEDIVKQILSETEIDINRANIYGVTPVMIAARSGHGKLFVLLVDRKCDLTVVDTAERNILHVACKGGSKNIVKYLLDKDVVDINSTDQLGKTPVFMAAEKGNKAVFDLMVEHVCDLKATDDDGYTVLHAACRGGDVDIVQYLISHEVADINCKSFREITPVMEAAEKGHKEVFDLLASKNCDLSIVSDDGRNLLHAASRGGNEGIVQWLLAQNIHTIDSRDNRGRTPVIEASEKGHKRAFDILVRNKCDLRIHCQDKYGILHAACRGGNVDIVKHLLSQKVGDVNNKDWNGITPAVLAKDCGNYAIVELLKDRRVCPQVHQYVY